MTGALPSVQASMAGLEAQAAARFKERQRAELRRPGAPREVEDEVDLSGDGPARVERVEPADADRAIEDPGGEAGHEDRERNIAAEDPPPRPPLDLSA